MASLSDQIGMEMGKSRQVDPLKAQIDEKQKLIARYNGDRKDLLPKDAGEMAERLQEVLAAAKKFAAIFGTMPIERLPSLVLETGFRI